MRRLPGIMGRSFCDTSGGGNRHAETVDLHTRRRRWRNVVPIRAAARLRCRFAFRWASGPRWSKGGGELPPYGGDAICYVEMGGEAVGGVKVNFLSGPKPTAVFRPPSTEITEEKRDWADSRRRRWFGS